MHIERQCSFGQQCAGGLEREDGVVHKIGVLLSVHVELQLLVALALHCMGPAKGEAGRRCCYGVWFFDGDGRVADVSGAGASDAEEGAHELGAERHRAAAGREVAAVGSGLRSAQWSARERVSSAARRSEGRGDFIKKASAMETRFSYDAALTLALLLPTPRVTPLGWLTLIFWDELHRDE